METPPSPNPNHPLHERREEIRRSLSRVNTANVAVVLVTIALAVVAGLSALRAGRQAELAREANRRAREELWKSYLAQAHAGRLSGVIGRKAAGLQAIAAAAAIRPSIELRNEAIAHLALLDFEPTGISWTNTPGLSRATIDPQFERHLESDFKGTIRIRRIAKPDEPCLLRNTNGFVARAEFASQGRLLLAIYENATLTVWDLDSRTHLFSRPGVAWAGFDDRGARVAVAGNDRVVRVLEAATGEEKASFTIEARANLGVFDSDGGRLALALPQKLAVWDWAKGRMTDSLELDHPAWSLAWRGNVLAAGDGVGEVHLWDLVTKRTRPLQAHQGAANHLAFNPRGDVLISTSYDGSTKAWDPFTGRLLLTTSHGFGTRFSPDGQQLLFGTESGWSLWRVSQPDGFSTLNCASGAQANVWHVDFSRDGRWLAATKADGVSVFSCGDGRRAFFQPANQTRAAYFMPGGTNLLTTSTRRIALWPIETNGTSGEPTFRLGSRQLVPFTNFVQLESGALAADRTRLALPVSRTGIAILDLERQEETSRLTNAILPGTPSFSGDGRWLAAGTFHGRGTRVWDRVTGQPVQDFNEGNADAFFSPDGRFLVSAGSRLYQVFEAGTWKRVFETLADSGSDLPNRVAFTGDSSLLALVKQRYHVELHHVGRWQRTAALMPPDPQVVTWLAFSPDDRHLAVATSQDLVQLWDLRVIRERLAALGLDWDRPVAPMVFAQTLAPRAESRGLAQEWSAQWMGPVIFGALVVIACTLFIRHRQRRLLRAYMEVDQLAEQQHLQLGQAQTEILHAQKMKALGTLAAGIAHDFNNLLSVIRMSNQLTLEAAANPTEVRENAQEIDLAVQQGKKLVRSMLGYSRQDSEESQPFSILDLVEDTVSLLSKQFLSGIALTLNLDQQAPRICLSRSRLEQVLLNLIVNASEAMNGQGSLVITVRRGPTNGGVSILRPHAAKDYWELSVRDSGPGIAPELIERVFEPFFTTKNRGAERGTGLGLSMVYRVAEHDGLGILVDSTPGHGTEFRLIVPVNG